MDIIKKQTYVNLVSHLVLHVLMQHSVIVVGMILLIYVYNHLPVDVMKNIQIMELIVMDALLHVKLALVGVLVNV